MDSENVTPMHQGDKILPTAKVMPRTDISLEMRSFFNLVYSLCKQYISWYERELKR